jgi:hypothetical protein
MGFLHVFFCSVSLGFRRSQLAPRRNRPASIIDLARPGVVLSGIVGALGPGRVGLGRSLSGGYAVALTLCIVLKPAAAVIVLCGEKRLDAGAIAT